MPATEKQKIVFRETERLFLRPFRPKDADFLFLLLSDEETTAFLPLFPFRCRKDAEHYLLEREKAGGLSLAVCLKPENIPVGFVTVSGGKSRDLGYCLQREYRGRGLMTEACTAVLSALREAGVPFVTATHDRNNPKSGAVMKRLGMRYCYSYEELWQPKNFKVVFRMYQYNLDGKERVFRDYWDAAAVRFVEPGL